ncbi:MAG: hypothetical protein LQ337_004137 [Flavoplaca oasis]|nr:MAG: hypothetical protein LQ337_004137 [Flavoplaca oasis]
MASLLFAGSVLAYSKIKDTKAKKARRKAHNAARYSDLQSSTCTCVPVFSSSSVEEKDGEEKDGKVKGCPVHDPALRKRGLKEEERREREELVRGEGKGDVKEEEKKVYTGDEEGDGEQPLVDTSAPGTMVGEEPEPSPPPKYEDVAVRPVGFKDRIRRKEKTGEEGIVR